MFPLAYMTRLFSAYAVYTVRDGFGGNSKEYQARFQDRHCRLDLKEGGFHVEGGVLKPAWNAVLTSNESSVERGDLVALGNLAYSVISIQERQGLSSSHYEAKLQVVPNFDMSVLRVVA